MLESSFLKPKAVEDRSEERIATRCHERVLSNNREQPEHEEHGDHQDEPPEPLRRYQISNDICYRLETAPSNEDTTSPSS